MLEFKATYEEARQGIHNNISILHQTSQPTEEMQNTDPGSWEEMWAILSTLSATLIDEAEKYKGHQQILTELLKRIIKEFESDYNHRKACVDEFNNNMPGVGRSVDYQSYPEPPQWYKEAKQIMVMFEMAPEAHEINT